MDNRERAALRELTEAARGFIDGKPKTLRRLRNATTEAERALAEARAAIEGEPLRDDRPNVSEFEKWWLGYSTDISREEIDLFDIPQMAAAIGIAKAAFAAGRTERVLEAPPRGAIATSIVTDVYHDWKESGKLSGETIRRVNEFHAGAAPLPTARDISVDELAAEIRRIDGAHNMGAGRLAEEIMAFISSRAPHPVSEGRLREALEAVIAADDIGLNTQMDPKFAAQFQKAARLCAAALESA